MGLVRHAITQRCWSVAIAEQSGRRQFRWLNMAGCRGGHLLRCGFYRTLLDIVECAGIGQGRNLKIGLKKGRTRFKQSFRNGGDDERWLGFCPTHWVERIFVGQIGIYREISAAAVVTRAVGVLAW